MLDWPIWLPRHRYDTELGFVFWFAILSTTEYLIHTRNNVMPINMAKITSDFSNNNFESAITY